MRSLTFWLICAWFGTAACLWAQNPEEEAHFYEAPHVLFRGEEALVLRGEKREGSMVLVSERLKRADLRVLTVYKPGLRPLSFEVPLRGAPSIPPVTYAMPSKLFTLSDIEGNFNAVTDLLRAHGVIDDDLRWAFGSGHLALLGDVFDRGNHVTECLWLLYRLEAEAAAAGGAVHMLLGNHETMVIGDDLRYLEPKYNTFNVLIEKADIPSKALWDTRSLLGAWLRSRNTVVKLGDLLLVHGGLSPEVVTRDLSLEAINAAIRAGLGKSKAERDPDETFFFGVKGPLWYRGYFFEWSGVPAASEEDLLAVLKHFGAERILVGHTIMDKPIQLFDGRVIAGCVKHPKDGYPHDPPRKSYGLLFQDGKIMLANQQGDVSVLK